MIIFEQKHCFIPLYYFCSIKKKLSPLLSVLFLVNKKIKVFRDRCFATLLRGRQSDVQFVKGLNSLTLLCS